MKARVIETGEIVEITKIEDKLFIDNHYCPYEPYEPYEIEWEINDNDYWARLEHQYAGMAMQGIIKRAYNAYCDDCANYENMIFEDAQALLKDHAEALADVCVEFAHALVEKLKEKEEGK